MNVQKTAEREPRNRRTYAQELPAALKVYDGWLIAFLLLVTLFSVLLFGASHKDEVGPSLIGIFLAGILFSLRYLFWGEAIAQLRWNPCGVAGLCMITVAGMSAALSPVLFDAHYEFLRMAGFWITCWMWSELLYYKRRMHWVIAIYLLFVSIVGLYALIQHAQGTSMVLHIPRAEDYGMRASGTYICPNHFAALIEVALCVAFVVIVSANVPIIGKVVAIYSILVLVPTLLLTQSRSGWIGSAAGISIIAFLVFGRRSRKAMLYTAVLVPTILGGVGACSYALIPFVRTRINDMLSGNVRLLFWKDTWSMIHDAPVWGWGLGSYRWVYPAYQTFKDNARLRYAHNELLHFTAELGVLGVLLLILAAGWLVWRYIKAFKRDGEGSHIFAMTIMFGAALAALTHSFFDYNLHVFSVNLVLMMFLGMANARCYAESQWQGVALSKKTVRFSVASLWLSISLVLLICSLRLFASHQSVQWGDKLLSSADTERYMVFNLLHTGNIRGRMNRTALEYERAEKAYRRAVAYHRANWLAYCGIGNVFKKQAFWEREAAYKEMLVQKAGTQYDKALHYNRYDLKSLYGESELASMMGDHDKAVAILEHIIEQLPVYEFYQIRLGLLLRSLGRDEAALQSFLNAKKLNSKDPIIRTNIRHLKNKINKRKKAVENE